MNKARYSCDIKKLHPDLKNIFHEKEKDKAAQIFLERKNIWFSIKFICFIALRVLGLKHYNTMGILGYSSYLFDEKFAEKLLINKNVKNLLDIGAGSGHITEKFSGVIKDISCLEPSPSFQTLLRKKGYTVVSKDSLGFYDIITIFNVLDICPDPSEIVDIALRHLSENGTVIFSLPFPIRIRHSNKKIPTNTLEQPQEIEFEKAVSDFYENFLKKHGLKTTFLTRLPYIVSLPEAYKVSVYDNAIFSCQKI